MYEEVPHQGFEPCAVVKEFHIPGRSKTSPGGHVQKPQEKPRGPSPWFFGLRATPATHSCGGCNVCLLVYRKNLR